MPIEFRCSQCERLLRTPDGTAGKKAKCPQCGAVVNVPTASPSQPTEPVSLPPVFVPPSDNPYQASNVDPHRSPFAGPGTFRPTPIDLGDVFGRTWQIYKERLGVCIAVMLLLLVLEIAISIPANFMEQRSLAAFIAGIVANVVGLWLALGAMTFYMKVGRGELATVGDLFSGGRYLLRGVGLWIILTIISGIGFVLCILPGIYVLLMFSQMLFILIDQDATVLDSLRLSREVMRGNMLTVLAMWLVGGIVTLIGTIITLGIGLIFLYPYFILLFAVAYLMMSGQATADRLQPQPNE